MREVVLKLTTQKDLIKHQSAASTFGELKREMKQVKWSGMRVVERASKATLQMDEAVLPQGDFLLFLVPEKVKSGRKTSGGASELSGPIEDCKYNELRSHISWLNREKDAGLPMSGGTADLQKILKKYYKNNPAGKSSGKPAAKPAAKKPAAKPAAKEEAPKAKKYKPTPKEDDEDDEDYADRIAYEEKAFNKKEKKRLAKLEEERLAKEKEEREKAEKVEKERLAKAEKKPEKKEKKGFLGLGKKAKKAVDPIETIEDARQMINMAVDEIVQGVMQGHAGVPAVLEYTAAELEKEAKEIHRKLRTGRSSAKYID